MKNLTTNALLIHDGVCIASIIDIVVRKLANVTAKMEIAD